MKTLRLIAAVAILRGAAAVAQVVAPEMDAAPPPSPAGRVLLASIVGMAICAMWIAIAWRAAG